MSVKLEDLGLKPKTLKLLIDAGVTTFEALAKLTEKDFFELEINGETCIGRKTLNEINAALVKHDVLKYPS